jgi:superoxide reductase
MAIERLQVWKCATCGNITIVLHAGGGTMTCCDQPMVALVANTVDAAHEKHVPVVEVTPDGVLVKVGAVPHPMLPEHFIEWIELQVEGRVCVKFLNPGDAPEALFPTKQPVISARAYCNLHGLWKDGA